MGSGGVCTRSGGRWIGRWGQRGRVARLRANAARRTRSHCLPASRGRPPRVHIASPRVADAWVTGHRAPYRGHLRAGHLQGPPWAEGTVRNRRNAGAIRVYTTASRDARCRPPRVLDREAVFVAKRIRNLLAMTFQAAYWGPRGVSIRLASHNRETRPKGQRALVCSNVPVIYWSVTRARVTSTHISGRRAGPLATSCK